MSAVHVVVGAGPVGAALARLLAERGDDVRVVTRSGSGPQHERITHVAADAATPRLTDIAAGATVIHSCVGLPYQRWASDWPSMAASILAAAERTGAVLTIVSNLYGYGPVDVPMTEDLPLAATGTKGRVRAHVWQEALAAHRDGRARVVEVRGSDYLCPGPGSQLGDRVVPRLLAGRRVAVLRSADTPHTWTSPDDVARLLVVVASDERAWGRAWHVPSNAPRTQREVVADLCRAAGVPPVAVVEHPALLIRALGLVNPLVREVREVAYQVERPFVLDSSAATSTFGLEPTPWADMLAAQVAAYRPTAP